MRNIWLLGTRGEIFWEDQSLVPSWGVGWISGGLVATVNREGIRELWSIKIALASIKLDFKDTPITFRCGL